MTELSCRGLTKGFPGLLALSDVDLDVRGGEVLVVLGENGAGKSTLMRILSGAHPPDAGTMTLDGRPYAPSSPRDAIAAGIGMIHQETALLPGLSVAENVLLGRLPRRGWRVDWGAARRAASQALARVGLRVDVRAPVAELPVAAQQQVEIARALSLDARLLILDEPTAALGAEESERLFDVVGELRGRGVGFVYISHRLREVARVGDRVVVLRDGQRVAAFDDAATDVGTLVRAMVGRSVDQVYPVPAPPTDDVVLRATGLSRAGAFADVSLELRRGEVLGLAGLVGAGRTEVARALSGADPAEAGTIEVRGRRVRLRTPAQAVAAGVVLVPEDRKRDGLVLGLPVADNVALPSLRRLVSGGVLRPSAIRDLAEGLRRRLDVRGRLDQPARTLSGGNQQKVVLAKWLPRRPDVVVFDEPTRGVDVGARAAIYDLVHRLAADGVGVLVISSELPEVLGLSHRVLVLARGRVAGVLTRDDATEEAVMALATGTAPAAGTPVTGTAPGTAASDQQGGQL